MLIQCICHSSFFMKQKEKEYKNKEKEKRFWISFQTKKITLFVSKLNY
jgi:hypothetical protein